MREQYSSACLTSLKTAGMFKMVSLAKPASFMWVVKERVSCAYMHLRSSSRNAWYKSSSMTAGLGEYKPSWGCGIPFRRWVIAQSKNRLTALPIWVQIALRSESPPRMSSKQTSNRQDSSTVRMSEFCETEFRISWTAFPYWRKAK